MQIVQHNLHRKVANNLNPTLSVERPVIQVLGIALVYRKGARYEAI
jgi:hypothetical protein